MGSEPKIAAFRAPLKLPNDPEAEVNLLGTVLLRPEMIDEVAAILSPDDFFDPFMGRIFAQMLALQADNQPITGLTLTSAMRGDPGFSELGPPHQVFSSMMRSTPGGEPRQYAALLSGLAIRRQMILACEDAATALYADRPLAPSIAPVLELSQSARLTRERPKTPAEIMGESLEAAEDYVNGGVLRPSVRSGLSKLDDETGGFFGSDLIVVPGRSGMGKSALLGSIAWRAAAMGHPVKVFSLEMHAAQWLERTLCDADFSEREGQAPISYSKFRRNALTAAELVRLNQAKINLERLPLEISSDDKLTMAEISARAGAFAARHSNKLGLVVIDYLQIVQPDTSSRTRTREQEVSAIVRGAKSLARRLGWPVIAGSQLNRQTEHRAESDRRPTLADIRESGSIENEADLIISPYRKAYYIFSRKPETAADVPAWRAELKQWEHKMDLICLKNRHGHTFSLDLFCEMAASAIRDSEPYDYAGFRQ